MDLELIKLYVIAITGTVTAANAITALTPTKVDDRILKGVGKFLNIVLKILNVLSGNVYKNRNADDPKYL